MPGIRVCLDCDHKVPSGGDGIHRIDDEVLIGCEGYRHRETENAVIEVTIDPESVKRVMDWITDHWMIDCAGEPSEDYADAFSYVGDLLQFISAEMLLLIYKDDKDEITVADVKRAFSKAKLVAEEAIVGLIPFGYDMSARS